jgi:hypothetical protein
VNKEIKQLKENTWKDLHGKIITKTRKTNNAAEMWGTVNKVNGKFKNSEISNIMISGKSITNRKEIAENLAKSFSEITSNKKYNRKTRTEIEEEKGKILEKPEDYTRKLQLGTK